MRYVVLLALCNTWCMDLELHIYTYLAFLTEKHCLLECIFGVSIRNALQNYTYFSASLIEVLSENLCEMSILMEVLVLQRAANNCLHNKRLGGPDGFLLNFGSKGIYDSEVF